MFANHVEGSATVPEDWDNIRDVCDIDCLTGKIDVRFYCQYVGTDKWTCFGMTNLIPKRLELPSPGLPPQPSSR
jgi:hypothetical protein